MIRPPLYAAAAAAALLLATLSEPALAAAQTTPTVSPATLPPTTQTDPAARPGPCPFTEIDIDRFGRQPFRNLPDLRAVGGSLASDLVVRCTDPRPPRSPAARSLVGEAPLPQGHGGHH
ncbi:MAG TPA: hypothetical protein VEG34_08840 [Thermoanaerobaculia bacterium]|nr:hypothetical protein [Thermoanaerobaculia bacterium]